MSYSKKVIVSGATGQDGSYMIEYLLANTENTIIAALRRTSQAILGNLKDVLDNPRVKLVTVDLCDGEAMRSLIRDEKPDYFINFGAQTFVSDSWKNPVAHLQTNAISLVHILEAIREYVPHCRLYSAGSSEQYGNVEYSPQDEKHPNRPRSVYGVSKVTAQQLCKVYRESYGLYVVHGILFNHESPRRQEYFVTRKITMGVARIARAIKDGKPFEPIELGNLDAKRDWSHAKDFVDGVWRMLNQESYRPDVLNMEGVVKLGLQGKVGMPALQDGTPDLHEYVLSSNETHSIREFAELACEQAGWQNLTWVAGSRPEDEYLKGVAYIDYQGALCSQTHTLIRVNRAFYRPAEVELLWGDSTCARTELGWTPRYSFAQLVTEMVTHDLKQVGL